jgi:hypothetical protein
MAEAFFFYDSANQALVFPIANGPQPMLMGIKTSALRAAGWKGADEDYARSLPRAGKPLIETATPRAVAEAAKLLRGGR